MNENVIVRFAPSPTGIPHVGNIRTALFDYFLAKRHQGTFILRIEDTDQARKAEGAIEAITESLEWLGVTWDQFITQSERLSEYKKHADELVKNGLARVDDGAIRFIVPTQTSEKISWIDAIGDKKISFECQDIEPFIILKADGFPTYHLANVVDDHLMNITHVIRGEDWISSTPKHILLYKAFGWKTPVFAHVPNVLGTDGKKLSKRRGAQSVLDFKKEGYLGKAMLNYLMLLGWSPKNDKEILSKDEIIKEFALDNVNIAPAIFDVRKLNWMNGMYIRETGNKELLEELKNFDSEVLSKLPDEIDVDKLIEIAKTRIKNLKEFKELITPFFREQNLILGEEQKNLQQELVFLLGGIEDWNIQNVSKAILDNFIFNKKVKYPQLYEVVLGTKNGLPLIDMFSVIGKESTLKLLQ